MPGALFFAARGNLGALRAATTPASQPAHGADPHDDAYDDAYADPYADPYDPHAVHAAPGRLSRAEEAKAEAELLAAAEGFLSTSPSASLHMGHLWGAQADAEAAAGAYQHAEYTLYADVLDEAPSSDEVQISLAEIRPLEGAVRTAHAEVPSRHISPHLPTSPCSRRCALHLRRCSASSDLLPLTTPYCPLLPLLPLTIPCYPSAPLKIMPQVLRLEMDLEVERAAAEAAAAGRAVGQAGEAARLATLRRELASKEARGAEVEAQVQQLEERLGALEAQVEAQG